MRNYLKEINDLKKSLTENECDSTSKDVNYIPKMSQDEIRFWRKRGMTLADFFKRIDSIDIPQ